MFNFFFYIEIYNRYLLYMSGFITKRVLSGRIGATIEKNQTPMQAGLVPRVGKSGASIRLYWKRVDGCECGCIPEPITILKRGIFPGDTVTPGLAGWNPPGGGGTGNLIVSNSLAGATSNTNVYYVVVFNREIKPSPSLVQNPTGTLRLRTPLGVNWNTFVLNTPAAGGSTGGEVINTNVYAKDIPVTDFKVLDFGNSAAINPNNSSIGRVGSGWEIKMDGTTQDYPPPFGGTPGAAGLVPANEIGVQGSGLPNPGQPLSFWAGNTINSRLAQVPPGLAIGLCSPANPLPVAQNTYDGAMTYLVTNPDHFGGYALVFNITRLIIASQTFSTNYENASYSTATTQQRQYRSGLANMTWYNTNNPPNRNNVGVAYNSNEKTILLNEVCEYDVPVASFKLGINSNTRNKPWLELIDSDNW
jgi:hypothetical protein